MRSLASAATAMTRAEPREMAEQLRRAWRDSKDPSLAGIYELLLSATPSEALEGDDPSERARAWRERAMRARGEPLELPVLLAEPSHPDLPEIERLQLLGRWTPDPLLAGAMVERLRLALVTRERVGAAQIIADTIRLLAAQRDPRQLDTLELLARDARLSSDLTRQLQAVIAGLRSVSLTPLDASARAALAPLEQRARALRSEQAVRAALLEAVHADPDADEPRLVYADWLTSHGDPRGEFITLQLERSGRPMAAPSARERALLRRHEAEWTGVLHSVLSPEGRVFERGFIAAGSIEASRLDRDLIRAGSWATLRGLDGHVPIQLVFSGRLDRLRTLYGFLSFERFVQIRASGRLEAVEDYECSLADYNVRFDTPLGLRSLLVRQALDERLRALLGSPACAGLEQLGVYYEPERIGSASRRWTGDHRERASLRARYQLLSVELPPHIQRLRMLDAETSRASRPLGCELNFERDADGRLSRVRLDLHPKPSEAHLSDHARAREVVGMLEPLLGQLTRVTLGDVGDYDRDALAEQLRAWTHDRPDLELVLG
ncbi:hypothetical protein DB30_06321 [Enhygromyxa salina]|uniref:Uncharacterized protein n=1 Tax=Enhygromyxa salina TaxID=215803 RepID=A0A0C2CYP5_9BACT|nr:hypothetical protein DB30_06321 [Enhygromyxa salina]